MCPILGMGLFGNENDVTLHRSPRFCAIFLNEFHLSSVISCEAAGKEAELKVSGDQLTKT
jgi:hypothetical protein